MKQSCNKKEKKNIYIFFKGEKLEKKIEKHFNIETFFKHLKNEKNEKNIKYKIIIKTENTLNKK